MTSLAPTRIVGAASGAGSRVGYRMRWAPATRRRVQVTLGVLWLVDALLQLQPYMFSPEFAGQMLAGAGVGQPGWVAGPVDFFARIIAAHPLPLNTAFALIQFALGIGFLIPRLVRGAIVGSLVWSAGIWWCGEGLGGLASGQASLVTGAPGAVLLYAVLAPAVWPTNPGAGQQPARAPVARWFPAAWALLWVGGAILQLSADPASNAALRDQIGGTDGDPAWLAQAHHLAGLALSHTSSAPFYLLAILMALVGLGGLGGRRLRMTAATLGAFAAIIFWVLGQNAGELYSGMATDPNTGPLIVVMALALAGISAPGRGANGTAQPHHQADSPSRPIRSGEGDESPQRAVSQKRRMGDDMNISKRSLGLLIAMPLLLTGCAAAYATTHHAGTATSMAAGTSMSSTASTSPSVTMSPGMTMSPGQSMPGMTMSPGQVMPGMTSTPGSPAAGAVNAGHPSQSASMICGSETATNVRTLMGLNAPAPTKATWVNHVYTCTYRLPAGPLVLSVKQSSDVAAAHRYFNTLRLGAGRTQPVTGLAGLGLPAYQNTTGTVVFLKDNMTLQVNASALPHLVGPAHTSRADLAYTVATDILACWTGK